MLIDHLTSSLFLIDVQEKLLPALHNGDDVLANSRKLVLAARALSVPISITEQYPEGLGYTVDQISNETAGEAQIFSKTCFSVLKEEAINDHLRDHSLPDRSSIVLAGAEAHVCVLQTAIDLVKNGFFVFVVADAIGSRTEYSHNMAIERMRSNGVEVVTTEMVMFEWIERSDSKAFKELRDLIV